MLREKGQHLLDETKLDKAEARIFIILLTKEMDRHITAKFDAYYKTLSKISIITYFYTSCIIRHQEDIDMIEGTIDYLKKKWRL